MIRVLFVCTGNICRSPTAEAVTRHSAAKLGLAPLIEVASAGTSDYHRGQPPDRRSLAAARRRNYDLSSIRARRIDAADFARTDHILAMDRVNLEALRRVSPKPYVHKVDLLLAFARVAGPVDVPDPYYGGAEGFELVLDLVERAAEGLFARLRSDLGAKTSSDIAPHAD
jgi:protein-tyrosine phosphatase